MNHRSFRIDDKLWRDAVRIAALRDERISDVLRDFLRGYVAKHRKLLAAASSERTSG